MWPKNKRSINYELPYSEWVYHLTRKQLSPLGFAMHHEDTGKPLAPANEFIFGRRDLTIYNSTKCEKHVEVLHLGILPTTYTLLQDMYGAEV